MSFHVKGDPCLWLLSFPRTRDLRTSTGGNAVNGGSCKHRRAPATLQEKEALTEAVSEQCLLMVIRWNDGAIVQTTVQSGEHTPFPALTFTLLHRRHGIRIKYKTGQYAASTALRWLWTDACSLSAGHFRATAKQGVAAMSCPALGQDSGTSDRFICTCVLRLKILALPSASFCTSCFIKNGRYQMFTSH